MDAGPAHILALVPARMSVIVKHVVCPRLAPARVILAATWILVAARRSLIAEPATHIIIAVITAMHAKDIK